MDRQPPPNFPDDFLLDDDHCDAHAIGWAAVALLSVLVIAAVLIWAGARA